MATPPRRATPDAPSPRSPKRVAFADDGDAVPAVSPDARVVVAGSSEGELLVFDGASLAKKLRVVPHDLFVTNLMLRASLPSGFAPKPNEFEKVRAARPALRTTTPTLTLTASPNPNPKAEPEPEP